MNSYARASLWLVGLSPLVWMPGAFNRFVFAKLLVVALAIAFGALAERSGKLPQVVQYLALGGLAWFAVAGVLSPTPLASLVGRWPRYEGLPVLALYVGAAWLGARLLGSRSRQSVNELFHVLSVSSLLLAFFSVTSSLGWSIEGASLEHRTGSVLGNATDQGMVGMMLCAVLVGAALDRRAWLLGAGAAAGALTVLLSGSRASLLALVVALLLHVVLRRRGAVRSYVAAGVGLALLALALPQIRDRIGDVRTITGRRLLWQEALQVGGDRWWSGGPSTFVDAVGRYRDQDWVREVGTRNPPDSPHSWPLQALVSGGVPMLLIAIALAVAVLVLGWKVVVAHRDPLDIGLFAATVGYGVALLANFTIAGSTCLAAFLAGCLVAEKATKRDEPRWVPRTVAVLAAAGVLALAAATLSERYVLTGIREARQGDVAAADAAFSTAQHLRPYDSDVAMLAAQSLAAPASEGDDRAAALTQSWARKSLGHTPETYAANLALAVAQTHDHDLDAAQRTLDDLVRWFPTEPGARVQRGIVRFGLEDVDGSLADLRQARRLAPHDPVPRRILRKIQEQLDATRTGEIPPS
ncbi:O-antigen ligase family protein [Marmoricola sp. RAF53]|uniref:O-antigen ligase family protein n=1 Tax=Marmoricola sp. RAF53 TaxID=3233059 RepID=UPI003F98131A